MSRCPLKGLAGAALLVRHALRASLVTFVGALLADLGAILGSAMGVDYLFQLNGLGRCSSSQFPVDFGSIDTYPIEPLLLLTALLVLASSTSRRRGRLLARRAGLARAMSAVEGAPSG